MTKRLLVAAAFSVVMEHAPTVVGGTAEEYWSRSAYHPTDLDLIPDPSKRDKQVFKTLGFNKEGRHWVREGVQFGVEFPHDPTFEVNRTVIVKLNALQAQVHMIGVDDLYLDRLGQATATMNVRDMHFASLVAVAVTNWSELDSGYITRRIREIESQNPLLGSAMNSMHRRCARKVRDLRARQRATELM